MTDPIPFNRPSFIANEFRYMREAIERQQLSGDGHFTKLCNARIVEVTGAHAALLTHSCTAALEMAAILADLGPGDEVILPSFTFVSTANAVVLRGAVPVFVDIDPRTLNIDPAAAARAVTDRTKAIMAVHYAGFPADMDALGAIAREHGLVLIEDAAQALGSTYKGRRAGSPLSSESKTRADWPVTSLPSRMLEVVFMSARPGLRPVASLPTSSVDVDAGLLDMMET